MLYSLVQLFEEVNRHGDKGNPADSVFAFLKAFYKVFHQKNLKVKLPCNERESPHTNR